VTTQPQQTFEKTAFHRLFPASLLLSLASLAAVAPLATDMYLPAFTAMAKDMGVGASTVQLTMTAFLVGIAIGQLGIGILSDRLGRRPLLVWGTILALAAGIAAAAAPDIAVLLHTGGTTGTPKAAMLTHTNLRANANQAIAWVPMLHEGGENFLCLLPFFHAFGLTFNLFCAVQKAATQVMLPKFSVDQVLAAHERRPFTFFVGVPVMFERILNGAQKRGTSLDTLRYGVED